MSPEYIWERLDRRDSSIVLTLLLSGVEGVELINLFSEIQGVDKTKGFTVIDMHIV